MRGWIAAVGLLVASCGAQAALTLSGDGLTVYDSANNVTWLADGNLAASTRFGLPVCSAAGASPCVNASGSMDYASAAAWVSAMNAANYLAHSNWQLPTTAPLDPGCTKTGPNGDSFAYGCTGSALGSLYYNGLGLKAPATAVAMPAGTTGPFSNLQPYLYWSQTSEGSSGYATFSFETGWVGANTVTHVMYVWPIAQGKLAGTPAATGSGLQVNPDGQTVYDPVSNVMWLANANLAATNTFGLPTCQTATTPDVCVNGDGSMNWDSVNQFIANMNAAAYLGQKNWQIPAVDPGCSGFNCGSSLNPMGELFYGQLGLVKGQAAVTAPNVAVGAMHDVQPYLYWSCAGATVQSACQSAGPVANQEWSFSFGNGFEGTDVVANEMFATAYFAGTRGSTSGPTVALVANAEGEAPVIAPNTWLEIKGAGLGPAGDARIWTGSDFTGGQMPVGLDGVSVTVNGKSAYVYYISPGQIDVLTPPDAMSGGVPVVVTNNGAPSAAFTAQAQTIAPAFFVFGGGPYVAATHANGSYIGPAGLYPGLTTPAAPGETILLYANGFGATTQAVVSGSVTQGGTLATLPVVEIGGVPAKVVYAGLVAPGEFQFNVVVPPGLGNGDQTITAMYEGAGTQAGTLITVVK